MIILHANIPLNPFFRVPSTPTSICTCPRSRHTKLKPHPLVPKPPKYQSTSHIVNQSNSLTILIPISRCNSSTINDRPIKLPITTPRPRGFCFRNPKEVYGWFSLAGSWGGTSDERGSGLVYPRRDGPGITSTNWVVVRVRSPRLETWCGLGA